MTATLPHVLRIAKYYSTLHNFTCLSLLSPHLHLDQREAARKMALRVPTTRLHATKSSPPPSPLLAPAANSVGLRAPIDRFALKSSFFSPSLHLLLASTTQHQAVAPPSPAPRFSMRVASKQAYICRDCGYIYNDRTPFEKLPDKFLCPVCGAPKRRFRPYTPAVAKNANQADIRKARKAELQRDEAIGKALPVAVVVGALALAALYFYLNNTFQG